MVSQDFVEFEARINNIEKWESLEYVDNKEIVKRLSTYSHIVTGICTRKNYNKLSKLRFLSCCDMNQ